MATSGGAGRRLSWIGLGLVVIVALVIGSGAGRGQTMDDRVHAIALTIQCPQCGGQSSATSEATGAVAIRKDIARRLANGQNADQIRDYYASTFGETILLNPSGSGASSLVWILPVVMLVATFGGIGVVLRRNRRSAEGEATDEDRELVAAAKAVSLDAHGEGSGR